MPRIPQYSYQTLPNCVIAEDDNVDLKLQFLEKKLLKKIDEKQNKLIAGENITIEDDVISAECGGSEIALMGEDIVVDTPVGHLGPNAQISKFTPVANVIKQILYKEGSDELVNLWFYQGPIEPEENE